MTDKDKRDKIDQELSQMTKVISRPTSIKRLIFAFFAFLIWVLLGIPPSLIYTSGIQAFIGTISFFNRNPSIFLLIALINIFIGLYSYFLSDLRWWAAFHIIWSIRWFYGYNRYRGLKKRSSDA